MRTDGQRLNATTCESHVQRLIIEDIACNKLSYEQCAVNNVEALDASQ